MKIKRRKKKVEPIIPVIPKITQRTVLESARSGVWDLERDGITQGLLSNFMTCPEKLRLASVEGLSQIRTGGALAFGSLIHDLLEKIYLRAHTDEFKGAKLEKSLNKLLDDTYARDLKVLQEINASQEDFQLLEENFAVAKGVLPGYLKRWEEDFDGVEWLALEEQFAIPVEIVKDFRDANVLIKGKRDGRFRSKEGGKAWLFETKTKGYVQEDQIMDKLVFDLQVMLYLWSMWKESGEVPGGVTYNIIRKPQLRQKKEENLLQFSKRVKADTELRPDFYYLRYQSSIVESDLVNWEKQFTAMLQQLLGWTRGEYHWKNSSACSMGGVTCQFLPVCSRGDRSGFKVRAVAYPELAGEREE